MTETDLRIVMEKLFGENLPDQATIREWSKATGLPESRVKQIYGEVIGDEDPWGLPLGQKDDGQ